MSGDVADPATGTVRLMAAKCDTCIFRPGNLMHLRPGRVKDMVDTCLRNSGHVVCHKTLDEATDGAICRGFADAYPGVALALRVGAAFGGIIEVHV